MTPSRERGVPSIPGKVLRDCSPNPIPEEESSSCASFKKAEGIQIAGDQGLIIFPGGDGDVQDIETLIFQEETGNLLSGRLFPGGRDFTVDLFPGLSPFFKDQKS